MSTTVAERPRALAPLRERAFRMLLAGRVSSFLGNAVAPIALAFAVLDITGSVSDLGIVVGARSLALVVLLLFGGVLADRLPRPVVLVGSSLLSGLTQGAVAALVLTHTATIPLLVGLGLVNGALSGLAFPASAAVVPQTVPVAVRQQANALVRLGTNGVMILGAAVGGVLVATAGPGWGLAVDAASFLLAGGFFAFVRVSDVRDRSAARPSTWADLRGGWTAFTAQTWVWVVVAAFGVINACITGGVQVLGPAVADHTIGRPAWGVVLAAETLGMVAGGLLALRLRVRRLLLFGMVCVAPESLLLLGLAALPLLPVLVVLAFVQGVAIEQFGVAWETSVQEHVPASHLARVYSYDALGSFIAIPIGETLIGPVAAAVGTAPTLVGAAGLVVVATLAALSSRSVRTLEHRTAPMEPTVRQPAVSQ